MTRAAPPLDDDLSAHWNGDHRRRGMTVVPPTGLVVLAVFSVQLGSAIATHLFQHVGPGGTASLRLTIGAVVLLAIWRPRVWRYDRAGVLAAILFGIAMAAMNFSFYSALERLPLGIAVTLEFVGPLGVAVFGSRRSVDVLWVLFAASGVILLTPWGGLHLNLVGVAFALLAGVFWASYILLSAQVGRSLPGGIGLAIAVSVGALALIPVGILPNQGALLHPTVLLPGTAVAILSCVVPWSLELEAVRHVPTRVFGVLMSTEPAVAALLGFVFLGQVLGIRALIALILVTVAAIGASYWSGKVGAHTEK